MSCTNTGLDSVEVLPTKEQLQILEKNFFYMGRIINGKLCALSNYATTVGLVVGIDEVGYERRYCYQNPSHAIMAIVDYADETVHAPHNWIKCKGKFQGEPIDLFNPNWKED